jgi:Ser/Thr protein kinase RdoA (MazF antagonist)
MDISASELVPMIAMLQPRHGALPLELRVEQRRLRGGLEAAAVSRVVLRYHDSAGRQRAMSFVVKRLAGTAAREARVYRHLVTAHVPAMAPRVLASHETSQRGAVLYLEFLRPISAWPWRALATARAVLEQVARLHAVRPDRSAIAALSAWDYERELRRNAELTLTRLEQVVQRREFSGVAGAMPPVRRLVRSLAEMRRQLLAFVPLGSTPIHGDLHPGNALVRRRGGRDEPLLIDWGRARIGSPLEDISTWLQSLAGWEPEARRRHDSLLTDYLAARGMDGQLHPELRATYWFAGASNALGGALLYHLTVMLDRQATSTRKRNAAYSTREWLRVLRRADAFWG